MLDWTALFPKQPYPIQLELAGAIYDTLQTQREKLLLVESPTGTGKTFSLLVPAMHWLIHNPVKLQQAQASKSLPSWLKKEASKGEELVLTKIKKLKGMISLIARVPKEDKSHRKSVKPITIDDIEDFGEELEGAKAVKRSRNQAYIERQLQSQEGQLPRIIFVSRTHSQLQQVMSSVRLISQQMGKLRKEGQAQLQTVHIASKEHLCINSAVNGEGNVGEKCKNLLKNCQCDYYHRESYKDFFNKDSEEGLSLGRSSSVCSYYGVRNISDCADILCVPYASLLTDETRRRSGISIRNAILVFDEGHNVMEFDRNAKSFEVYYRQIVELCRGIDEYVGKYRQISAKTALLLEHWLTVLRSLLRVGKDRTHAPSSYSRLSVLEFLLALGITSLRIHEIKQYVDLTDFDQKVVALCPVRASRGPLLTVRAIRNVLDFLMQLSSVRQGEESVVLLKGRAEDEEGSLSILCLESQELQKIVKQSRLTIFAGGTMEPLSDFQSLMDSFPHKILRFKHVVRREQCTIYTVGRFETKEIRFTFDGLKTSRLWLGSVIRVVVDRVLKRTQAGGGVVLFVQNYQIVELFRSVLQHMTDVFYDEPAEKLKGGTEQSVFEKYSAAIYASRRAVLVSVMGGRLSEGINFNDSLARALVVFGMPYANLMAPQVKEMMGYRGGQGQLYYENLCMKTLNQTIGRAIRHINDYADCFLIDARFKFIGGRLSEWMRQRVVEIERLEDV